MNELKRPNIRRSKALTNTLEVVAKLGETRRNAFQILALHRLHFGKTFNEAKKDFDAPITKPFLTHHDSQLGAVPIEAWTSSDQDIIIPTWPKPTSAPSTAASSASSHLARKHPHRLRCDPASAATSLHLLSTIRLSTVLRGGKKPNRWSNISERSEYTMYCWKGITRA